MMTREELTAFVAEYAPDLKPGMNKQFPELIIPAQSLPEVASRLKHEPATRMDYLFCLTAADRKDGFHMIYHISSTSYGHAVMIRVVLPDKVNPSVSSVSNVWKAAEYYEREVFDLFGIAFANHPDLRRLFLEEDWVGHPLRKDYKDSFTLEN
jgi:NADH:ubiquinone oxidoreductase subunit C